MPRSLCGFSGGHIGGHGWVGRRTGAGGKTSAQHLRPLRRRLQAGALRDRDRHCRRQLLPAGESSLLHTAAAAVLVAAGEAGEAARTPGAGSPAGGTRAAIAADGLRCGPLAGRAAQVRYSLALPPKNMYNV
jgi:hypothetical protein